MKSPENRGVKAAFKKLLSPNFNPTRNPYSHKALMGVKALSPQLAPLETECVQVGRVLAPHFHLSRGGES